MSDDTPAQLSIVTSLSRAIDIYPSTEWSNHKDRNIFMSRFTIEFRKPGPQFATFVCKGYAPTETWFSLFDDAEKEVMEDEFTFYGVRYQTITKLAVKRVESLLRKMGEMHHLNAKKNSPSDNQRFHYQLEELGKIKEGLKMFDEKDEVVLTFLFPEWPDIEVAKKTEYIKRFENKILGQKRREIPYAPF